MKVNKKKLILILLIIMSILSIGINSFAHSGKTDSNGGHRDNKNKSGLGSYHYHCGGYPAHLHTNGVCPYASTSSSSTSATSSSSSSSTSTTTSNSSSSKSTEKTNQQDTSTSSATPSKEQTIEKPSVIDVNSVVINEKIESIEVGQNIILTATITPDNATDKNIVWKSDNEDVATISSSGKIVAKVAGIVTITASASNGKSDTISINIKEKEEEKNNVIENLSVINSKNAILNNTKQDNNNLLGGTLTLGILGIGGCYGYSKYRKNKNKYINNENKENEDK